MEYQQADRDYIRLSIAFEGRAKQANELLRNFDSISELFEAIKNADSDILTMIKREQAEKLRLTASDVYIDDFISDLEKNGVSALTPNSEAYPTELKYIADPPFVLYARGKCARLQAETPFAIIGEPEVPPIVSQPSVYLIESVQVHAPSFILKMKLSISQV